MTTPAAAAAPLWSDMGFRWRTGPGGNVRGCVGPGTPAMGGGSPGPVTQRTERLP